MAEKDGAVRATAHRRPTIALPPRSSVENFFIGGAGASPGPMTLVSNFFSENDPDSECGSFSQLLAGAMASPVALTGRRPSFLTENSTDDSSKERGSGDGGGRDFRIKQNRPLSLVIAQSPMFTVPPGLSPASLLDSPGFFSPGQGHFGMSHQQALAQVTAQAAQSQSHMHIQAGHPFSLSAAPAPSFAQHPSFTSNATTHQQMPSLTLDAKSTKMESSEVSHSDQRFQPPSRTVDKSADDVYNWRKYGQKQVKGSEYPRSYYKCTHPSCSVKKKVERSLDGQVTEIIYKGQHNHQPPQPNRRTKDSGISSGSLNIQGNSEMSSQGQTGNLKRLNETIPAHSIPKRDQESSQTTPEQLSASSDSEEVGDAETRVYKDNDEPDPKKRNIEVRVSETASSHRTVTEPRIIVQTTSEVDLLDDGYRWRKYGQKVVKGNPHPRSYYKCTNNGCNVRKHVERASTDARAVITTYEGKHNHDVPAAKNSSHNTANGNPPQLKPHNILTEKHALLKKTELRNNGQQPVALQRLKEEQIA
ncbi:hypothetical protein HHK36_024292 [Tetracentron sinense]|uniref:WRKY domain-containing protein n=1 Tax=Tetracentron sinense TaxID=13715 RepID=A0A835D444_TETSI|nr:hypothetical protein HHK36_024292 [Tetracentron sinense]